MKKIIYTSKISIVALILLLSSCTEHLDLVTYNNITGASFWKTPGDAETAAVALHASYMSILKGSNDWISPTDGRTDAWQPGTLGPRLTGPVEGHFQTANNGTGNWRAFYTLIHHCNLMIQEIENIDFGDNTSQKNDLTAQAYTIRAMTYFELARIYGDVPLVTEPTVGKPEVEEYPGRSPKSEIFTLIKADIDKAISLYSSNTFGNNNFVSKLSTYALKAEVYMWTAKALSPRGSSNAGDLNTAIDAISFIENSGDVSFMSDYSEIFTRDGNDNSEYILSVWYEDGLASSNYAHASMRDDAVPEEYIVRDTDGSVIKYMFPLALEDEGLSRMSYGEALNDIYTKYETVEPHDNPFDNNDDAGPFYDKRDLRYVNNCVNATVDDNVVIKYKGFADVVANRRWWDNDIPIYRLTGMLLLKAEAYNTLGNPEAAIAIMDQTRARAGLAPYPGARDQATVEDELLDEAIRELFGENKRWWHLCREHRVADYVPRYLIERGNDKNASSWDHYYWPIPESVLIANPQLTQSPGY